MCAEKNAVVRYLLDTSALIAYLGNEEGAEKVSRVRNVSSLPFIAISELYYVVWLKKDKAEADRIYGFVKSWRMPVLSPTEKVIITAGRIKAVYKLGVANSYIAAFAHDAKVPLMTKDEDFSVLKDEIEIVWIHRKK